MKKIFLVLSIFFFCLFNSYSLKFYSNEAIEEFALYVQENYCPNLSKKSNIKIIISEEEMNKINKKENAHAVAWAYSTGEITFNPYLLFSDNAICLICHEIAHLESNVYGHGKTFLTTFAAIYDRVIDDLRASKLEDLLLIKEFHKMEETEWLNPFEFVFNTNIQNYTNPEKFKKNEKLYSKIYNFKKED